MLRNLGWNQEFENTFSLIQQKQILPARIISRHKNHYRVAGVFGETMAVIQGKIHYGADSNRDYPVVGDWVTVSVDDKQQVQAILAILPRQNALMRKMSGSRKRLSEGKTEEQVIGANIDLIFIIMGLDRDYNLNRLERYLSLVLISKAKPVIILNKSDLCPDIDLILNETNNAISGRYPVHAICAKQANEVAVINQYLGEGITGALIGSSGVGKSTVINALLGEERQAITEISASVAKGRHTTTHRELILLPQGGLLMDNPGMREIQLWVDSQSPLDSFADIEQLAGDCKFNDCRHETEPGCAVKKALEAGDVSEKRLANYVKQKRELDYLDKRQSLTPRTAEREKWREIYSKAGVKKRM
jgi:ribosome biogenesis GTPase